MDSPGEWILLVVIFLFQYWMAPALVLLNWLLTRCLEARLARVPLITANLAISLLLLGPIKERGGGLVLAGDFYYPWYLGGFRLDPDHVWWLGLVLLCAVSVVTTVRALSHPKLFRAGRSA
jgi:hypothetical protein